MGNTMSLLFVITSLTFLVSGAICSQLSVLPVFAEPPDPCFGDGCEGTDCADIFSGTAVQCCWTGPNGDPICQVCWINPEGGFGYCDPPRTNGRADSSTIAPPPSGVAPPPPPGPGQGGPGNVLPEGVFEGLTTPPPQQKMTPEITPLPPTCPPGQVLDEDTNLCFRVPQEQEEQQQQSEVTEEKQPVPVCQEGLEFNENLGFCVPEDCPEGQVLDEESGICVLEEPEAAEDPAQSEPQEEQSEPEEPEQPSSEGDGSQDSGNNDDN
jgi:hypothetical protein